MSKTLRAPGQYLSCLYLNTLHATSSGSAGPVPGTPQSAITPRTVWFSSKSHRANVTATTQPPEAPCNTHRFDGAACSNTGNTPLSTSHVYDSSELVRSLGCAPLGSNLFFAVLCLIRHPVSNSDTDVSIRRAGFWSVAVNGVPSGSVAEDANYSRIAISQRPAAYLNERHGAVPESNLLCARQLCLKTGLV